MKKQIGLAAFFIAIAIYSIAGCSQSPSTSILPADSPGAVCDPPVEDVRFDGKETKAITQRLKEIFVEDQSSRDPEGEGWTGLAEKDYQHRLEVMGYLQKGQITRPESLFYAALVFQHGICLEHYVLARDLAERSMEGGYEAAGWLYAATVDRYLVHSDQLQKYGTQACRDDGVWHVCPVDPQTTDEERSKLGVPPLTELEAIAALNADRFTTDERPVALPPIDAQTRKIIDLDADQFYRAKNGWIALMLDGKYVQAADLIDLYLIYHWGDNLGWLEGELSRHAGQLYASAGQNEKALEHLENAQQLYKPSLIEHAYTKCVVAFVQRDRSKLMALRDSLAKVPTSELDKPLKMSRLQEVDNLIANYDQPYMDASMGQTKYLLWALALFRNPFFQFFFLLLLNVIVGVRLGLFSSRDTAPSDTQVEQAAEMPGQIEKRYPIFQSVIWAGLALGIILLELVSPPDYPHDHIVSLGLPLFVTAAIFMQGITALRSGVLPMIGLAGFGYRYETNTSHRRKGMVRLISVVGLLILTTVFVWASYMELQTSGM